MNCPNANRLISQRLQETADFEYAFVFPGVEEGNAFQQVLGRTKPFNYFYVDEDWKGSNLIITMIGPILDSAIWWKLVKLAKKFQGKVDPRRVNPMTEKDAPKRTNHFRGNP